MQKSEDHFCCIKCGISQSWTEDPKHCKTKLARRCKGGFTENSRHWWGKSRIDYFWNDIIER